MFVFTVYFNSLIRKKNTDAADRGQTPEHISGASKQTEQPHLHVAV